jgi:hypothetical protein
MQNSLQRTEEGKPRQRVVDNGAAYSCMLRQYPRSFGPLGKTGNKKALCPCRNVGFLCSIPQTFINSLSPSLSLIVHHEAQASIIIDCCSALVSPTLLCSGPGHRRGGSVAAMRCEHHVTMNWIVQLTLRSFNALPSHYRCKSAPLTTCHASARTRRSTWPQMSVWFPAAASGKVLPRRSLCMLHVERQSAT